MRKDIGRPLTRTEEYKYNSHLSKNSTHTVTTLNWLL